MAAAYSMGSAESRAEDSDARSSEPRPVLTGERLAPPHRASTLADDPQLLELLAEDSRLNVYAGKFEVRPPGAPTMVRAITSSIRARMLIRRRSSVG
jgi:hypothetical protein